MFCVNFLFWFFVRGVCVWWGVCLCVCSVVWGGLGELIDLGKIRGVASLFGDIFEINIFTEIF